MCFKRREGCSVVETHTQKCLLVCGDKPPNTPLRDGCLDFGQNIIIIGNGLRVAVLVRSIICIIQQAVMSKQCVATSICHNLCKIVIF